MKITKSYILVFTYVIIGLTLACENSKKSRQTDKVLVVKNVKLKSVKSTIIKVVSDDSRVLEHTAITDFNIMPNTGDFYSKSIENDTLTFAIDSIYKSHILRYSGIGNYNSYRTKILVSPGDSVLFKIKNSTIEFIGKNAANYNFYNQLDSTDTDWAKIGYKGDIFEYKKRCKANFLKRQQFLKTYVAENNVSDDFETIVGGELQQEYLWNLMGPRSIPFQDGLFYFNNLENLVTTIAKDYSIEKDGLFNLQEYFDHIELQDFNKSEQLNSPYGKNNLISFLRQYFLNSEYTNYSQSKFLEEKKFIQENFISDIETFAIARLLIDYYKNGFGITNQSKKLLEDTIEEYYVKFSKEKSYKEKIDNLISSIENINTVLSDDLLQTKLINIRGDTISLKDVFKKSNHKIKIIDFWASWCIPCIDEIVKTKIIRNKMKLSNDVEWVYFSIDNDVSAWKKKSKKLAEYGLLTNQYLIPNFKASELNYYLKVKTIPRYVIFDKQNLMVAEDSPRPSDSIALKKIIDNINSKE
ncbi:hypothetical protein FF125_01645 [Aureibaculum algae]|uniref:Thioredoxin domain-containing protein n=1 Tax=Aureibaculum algae TaxID=2584122 RepID=A0A5B7TLK5_9FLAO|nr:thioredoxin-like domain-containing protein [Aureibaculum algae]QCX37205.1 hypothetical protein FF125_01645 [Aureibaculum algae]